MDNSFPNDFAPTEAHLNFALKNGKERAWVMCEIERCRNWYRSNGIARSMWGIPVMRWLERALATEFANENKTQFKSGDSGWAVQAAKPDLVMAGIVKYARVNPSYAKHLLNLQGISVQKTILAAVPEDVRGILCG